MASSFAGLFDRSAVGFWQAPGRANLIGEHLDYNDGLVLPFALDLTAVVAVAPRRDRVARIASVQQEDVVEVELGQWRVDGWPGYVVGCAWALEQHGIDVPGFDLLIDSDVPLGSGLSSSAALEIACTAALADLAEVTLDPLDLALLAHRAESSFVGAPVGVMDHIVSACATEGHALLLDCRSLERTPVPLDLPGCTLLVIDTHVRHSNTDGAYAERRGECERAAELLGVKALRDVTSLDETALPEPLLSRARHVVTEMARVRDAVAALREGDADALGRLLLASHRSLRDDFVVSCVELDRCVEAAVAAGALGARLTGAGLGGCAIALVPQQRVSAVKAALHAALPATATPPQVHTVRPAPGAARIGGPHPLETA